MFGTSFLHDLRFALRSSRKTPGTTFVVILTLAVAIGANTAIFSVVESVLLRPLPYPDESRIVRVAATVYPARAGRGDRGNAFAERGYWHFANNQRSFEKFGGYYGPEQLPLTGDGRPREVGVASMTLSAFQVLGVPPELGRLPTPEEDAPGGPLVALLSHDLWVSRYGAAASILGSTVEVNGTPREVIGVMPASYDFPTYPGPALDVDLWIPFQLDPASTNFGSVYIGAIARLAPGVTIEAATDDARSLVARLDEAGYPPSWFESIFDGGAVVRPFRDYVGESARQPLLIVLGTVGFVLLIACSNVANLLLVSAESRRQESAVRMALGSGRARLARQMLVESTLLALAGGAAGVLLAHAGTRALVALGPASTLPRLGEVGIDGAALAFTAVVSVLTGLLFGVLPAFRSSSADTLGALRDGGRNATLGRHRHRTRNALVMTQVALAFVLVIGSGLMVRSFAALRSVDPGFATANLLTFRVQPLATKYGDAEALARLYDRLIERLTAVPGVTRAAAINSLPFSIYHCCNVSTVIEEFPPAEGQVPPGFITHRITPEYFETMGIPVVEGRAFTPDDHRRRLGSVIISRSVKERYWPDTGALGKQIRWGRVQARVVGVVGDVHDLSLDLPPDQNMYLPMLDAEGSPGEFISLSGAALAVRTAVEPQSLVSAIRGALAEVDPDLPIADVHTMDDVLAGSMARTSFTMSLLVLSALIALFLGAVGLYAVLSYVVSQRAPEIGIRSALGATPQTVRRMFLSQGMRLALAGVLIGLVAAVAFGRVLLAQLYGVSPVDPVTLVAGAAIFLAVAALASLLPAAR
ncbi:MAG TPA: ABC transporter permease, partial [Gammaproteobacteria bacterium]|nr:ABC transporter permease [Gammaproteobacteria bacterium]